jgi:hypothetical protein
MFRASLVISQRNDMNWRTGSLNIKCKSSPSLNGSTWRESYFTRGPTDQIRPNIIENKQTESFGFFPSWSCIVNKYVDDTQ